MNWVRTQDRNAAGGHLEFAPGFPLADVTDCGPALVAYASTRGEAEALMAGALQHIVPFISAAPEPLYAVEEAYKEYLTIKADRPVIWADVQDNPGCGGEGNTTDILRYLCEAGAQECLMGVLNRADIAQLAHQAGVGGTFTANWESGTKSFQTEVTVEALSDGRFSGTGAFYLGCDFDLGRMACVRTGGVKVIISSKPQQAADRAMFEHLGVRPDQARLLVLKSAVHFRADFSDMEDAIFLVKADGMAPADPADLRYSKAFQ